MGRFEYECPECDAELRGDFGDNVYCKNCDITFGTDWDYTSEDSMGAWITGEVGKGKIDIDEE